MVKHIIFDLGRVLVGFDPLKYLKEFPLSEVQVEQILQECFHTNLWNELDRGTYTYREVADIIGQRHPELNFVIHQILGDDIYGIFTELEAGRTFLEKCVQQNYSCYYLTNFGSEGFHYVNQKFDFFRLFQGGTASYEIHSIKPEPEIYLHFLKKYGLKAEECLFIDDNLSNVQAAQSLGFYGIVCTDHRSMEKEFEQLLRHI